MSWILTSIYSFVTGVDEDAVEKEMLDRQLAAEIEKRNYIENSIAPKTDYQYGEPCGYQNVVFAIVDKRDWFDDHSTEFCGQANGKTRVYLKFPWLAYVGCAFEENIRKGTVEYSRRDGSFTFFHAGPQNSDQRQVDGKFVSGPALTNERVCVIAITLDDDVAQRLSEDVQECDFDDAPRIYTNADYTLEYEPCKFRLHLNKPINKSMQCWWKYPSPELPVKGYSASFVKSSDAATMIAGLKENAKQLGWPQKKIDKIKFATE